MAKQTSRMYGIKVKEKVNYYEFGANDGFITLSYLSDIGSGAWQIKAGKHDGTNPKSDVEWWYNGSKYDPGDVIETFNDGDILTLHILESHTDVTPYTNYMYDIFGNASENIQYGNKDVVYKIMPGSSTYSCKVTKMENGITVSSKEFTSEDILQYKNSFSMLYPVYNMKFDWHGMDPSSGYPQMSFQAISDSNYIKYNGNTKTKGETIKTWQAIGFTGFEVTDDTNKNTAQSSTADAVPSIHLCKRIGGAQICVANKDKKTIFSDVFYDHKDVYYNGHYHKAMFLVYDNPGVADCWKKKLDGLALTYARPYWFLMTTRAGIEYNGRTYEARQLIRSWPPSDSVNMTLKETISRTKEKVEVDVYDQFVYFISEQSGTDQIVIDYKQIVPTDDDEGGYYNDYRDIEVKIISSVDEQPINYKKLKFELNNGSWTIYSKSAYIIFNGNTYKSGKALTTFPLQGAVDIIVYDESDKYQTQYEHIVYDVEQLENVDSVTVKKQIVTQVQDEQGHSHKEYVDLDSTTFDSSSSTVKFQNIEFRRNGATWTIYSKCGYIKYNGRTYYNNRSILSFAVSEAIHIEIADESDKYIIKEAITYLVKTPDSDVTVGYSLHTSETALTMKIVKTSGDKEEPWVTVNFYEAIYQPFMHDDISLMFDTKEMKWELYSNNDNLYYNGTNYAKGDKLGEWPYRQIVKIGNIIVTHENHDAIQISKTSLANGKLIKNEDVDEDIAWHNSESVDFHISYSYAKGIWVIKAVHDCWCDGIKYTEGQVIKQFKTKVYVEPFSILCQYQDDPESPIYTNIVYGLNVNITPDGVTTITIDSAGHNSATYSDKDISHGQSVDLIVTKQDARSMYGYIWQKEETPPPGPWPSGYIGDIIIIQDPSDNRWGTLCYIIPNELYHRKILPTTSRQPWLRIYLSEFSYFFNTENEFYVPFGVNEIFWYCSVSDSNDYIFQTQRRMATSFYIPQTQGYFNNFDMVGKFIEKESCVSIYSLGTYGDLGDRWLFLIMKAEYSSSGWINVRYQQAIDIAVYDWQQALQTDFDQLNAAGYVIWASYMNPYTKVNSLNKAVYFCCPRLNLNVDLFKYLTFRFYQETLSLIEIPSSITNEIKSSVVPHHGKNIEVNIRTIYFNNTFYLIIYAGVHENFNGNGSYYSPETWDSDYFINPHVFLLTYNDISGFHLYNLDNDVFGTADRVSPILETPIGAGRSYYILEKYYSVPTRLYTYQNELYISDIRYDEIVDGEFGKSIVYKRCIYKLDEQNHTFIKVKEFKIEDTISVYDIVNKENVEINICQFLLRYDFITHNSENFTHLEHIQNVSRSLRRKDLVNGLYFIYLKNRTQTIYYFTNPLFDEDIMNFCFPANEIGFRDRYSEDGNF